MTKSELVWRWRAFMGNRRCEAQALAALSLLTLTIACASSEDLRIRKGWRVYDASLQALVAGEPPYAALDGRHDVALSSVTPLPGDLSAPEGESLGLPGLFRIEPAAQPVASEEASEIIRIVRSRQSWRRAISLCIFEPTVAVAFPDRDNLTLLVCFQCREVAAIRSNELLGKWALEDAAAARLLDITRRYLPQLPTSLPE